MLYRPVTANVCLRRAPGGVPGYGVCRVCTYWSGAPWGVVAHGVTFRGAVRLCGCAAVQVMDKDHLTAHDPVGDCELLLDEGGRAPGWGKGRRVRHACC